MAIGADGIGSFPIAGEASGAAPAPPVLSYTLSVTFTPLWQPKYTIRQVGLRKAIIKRTALYGRLARRLAPLVQPVPIVPTPARPRLEQRQRFAITYKSRHKPFRPPPRKKAFALAINTAEARVSWSGVEVAHTSAGGEARVSWSGAEAAHSGNGEARVSFSGAEVPHSGNGEARVAWSGVEVVRTIADKPRRRQLIIPNVS